MHAHAQQRIRVAENVNKRAKCKHKQWVIVSDLRRMKKSELLQIASNDSNTCKSLTKEQLIERLSMRAQWRVWCRTSSAWHRCKRGSAVTCGCQQLRSALPCTDVQPLSGVAKLLLHAAVFVLLWQWHRLSEVVGPSREACHSRRCWWCQNVSGDYWNLHSLLIYYTNYCYSYTVKSALNHSEWSCWQLTCTLWRHDPFGDQPHRAAPPLLELLSQWCPLCVCVMKNTWYLLPFYLLTIKQMTRDASNNMNCTRNCTDREVRLQQHKTEGWSDN